jgi:LuxR family transcriptional regulator, maltose regulon positive regulatory protein
LHRRASAWYAAAGQLELAVGHALAANDPDQAASLLEPVAFSLLLQQSEVLLMHRLLERLPITAILARPRLLLAYGTALLLTGQYAAAEQLLNQMPPVESDADLAGEYAGGVTLLHSAIARFQGKSEQTLVLAQRALQQLPQDALIFRTAALLNIGVAYLKQGETAAAHDALTATLALANESGAEYLALAALEELATDQARRGQLLQTKQTCEQALARAARWRGQPMPAAGLAAISIGEVLVEWNELARAAQVLTQGIQLLRSTSEPHLLARGYSALARQQWAAGTGAAAFVTLDEGEQWLTQMQLSAPTAHAWFAAQRARLHLRQSDLAAVRRWEGEIHPQGESPLAYLQQLTRVRLRLAQHLRERQPQSLLEAAALLAPLLTTAEGKGWNSHVIEILMLQAVIEQAQGQRTLAHHTLARALTLAEPEGYLRLFVDEGEAVRFLILDFRIWILQQPAAEQNRTLSAYADKILATFDPNPLQADQLVSSEQPKITTPKSQLQNLIEPLSDRELEVLHLVAAGLSNSQIAARLIVTTGTVKTHINHIFGKLGVQSRTQAAAQARLVGLL